MLRIGNRKYGKTLVGCGVDFMCFGGFWMVLLGLIVANLIERLKVVIETQVCSMHSAPWSNPRPQQTPTTGKLTLNATQTKKNAP
jgi:hypothetical protein